MPLHCLFELFMINVVFLKIENFGSQILNNKYRPLLQKRDIKTYLNADLAIKVERDDL